ncbi:MAG: GNAT family N-acetyltransferase [Pseudomonadota bacterium]
MDITFHPVEETDLSLIRSWMEQPHWREWWGDPDEELELIRGTFADKDTTKPFIFHVDDVPTGYIQYWFVRDAKVPPWNVQSPWVMDFDDETIGVDMSIGDEADLGKGIGTIVLTAFIGELCNQGFTKIIIDPDRDNKRAIRAYEKAGFVPIKVTKEEEGAVLLMRFEGDTP